MTKTEKAYAMADIAMKDFGEVPMDFSDYLENQIPTYLFYSKQGKMCYCSKCHADMAPWGELKHNEKAVCPKCGVQATAKSIGMARFKPEPIWSAICDGYKDGVRIRHFRTLVDWSDYRKPIMLTEEMYRNIVTESDYKEYMYWHDNKGKWRWMPWKQRGYSWQFQSDLWSPTYIHYYNDLEKVVKGTPFKYCPLKELVEIDPDRTWVEGWLNSYKQFPQLEMLIKVGFKSLVRWCRQWGTNPRSEYNFDGKDIYQVLKVSRKQYKLLLKIGDPTIDDLRAIRRFDCDNLEDLRFCQSLNVWDSDRKLAHALQYTTKDKLRKYFAKENMTNITNYDDYLTWLEELHYPMEKYYLFPNGFKEAHDKLCKEKQAKADQIARERKEMQRKIMAKLKADKDGIEAFHMHYGGLFVRIAESPDELIEEGKALHHCVGTYVDRVAKGLTTILFIRKEEAPDVPFYTMEFKEGRVTQLYGKYDCKATAAVQEFRDEFVKKIENEFREEKKAA